MPGVKFSRMALVSAGLICMAALSASAVATAGVPGSAAPGRAVIAGSKPLWTAGAAIAADVPAAQTGITAKVWLAPRNQAQLDALATAVSDPSDPHFGQFISEQEYRAQFAPSGADVAQVTQWLTTAGLSVTSIGADNHFVGVSGSADAIQRAFGTQLAQYVVQGVAEQAPTSDISVPETLTNVVQAVSGLASLGRDMAPADFGPQEGQDFPPPCSAYYGQQAATALPKFHGKRLPWAVCGYTPAQLRGAYGVGASRAAGAGATVAIVDAYDEPSLLSDANIYSQRHGDRPFAPGQFRDLSVPENAATGADCGGNGWYGEQAMDVEAVHGMAPAANVLYYGAASCTVDDLFGSLARIVADNQASIVSNSWGGPAFLVVDGQRVSLFDPSTIAAFQAVFKQGAVQGIGFYFASGDFGDELALTGYSQPEYPASDPWITAVGGTALAIDRRNKRSFETGWGRLDYSLTANGKAWMSSAPFYDGAGGGFSEILSRPAYQNGVVPANTTGRAVPDVAMDADPTTGMLVGQTQSFALAGPFGPAGINYGEARYGGTSLSVQLFAGIQAVAQGRQRIGFANPLIYRMAKRPGGSERPAKKRQSGSSPFYDVTPQGDLGNVLPFYVNNINADGGLSYALRTFDTDSSLTTGPGWDDVTGVGSPASDYIDEFLADNR
jgi:subtilase family serine protease